MIADRECVRINLVIRLIDGRKALLRRSMPMLDVTIQSKTVTVTQFCLDCVTQFLRSSGYLALQKHDAKQ